MRGRTRAKAKGGRDRGRELQERRAQQNIQSADQKAGEIRQGVFQDLVKTNLSEGSFELLKNLVTRDWVLSYLREEEITEIKWSLRVKKELFFSLHPPEKSFVTGDDRAYINDDPNDTLRPLTDQQEMIVDDFFTGIYLRVLRSRDMKQQELTRTEIRESRDDIERDSNSGGVLGRLRS